MKTFSQSFPTLPRGVLLFIEEHLARLYEGAKALDMRMDLSPQQLQQLLYDAVDANDMAAASGVEVWRRQSILVIYASGIPVVSCVEGETQSHLDGAHVPTRMYMVLRDRRRAHPSHGDSWSQAYAVPVPVHHHWQPNHRGGSRVGDHASFAVP